MDFAPDYQADALGVLVPHAGNRTAKRRRRESLGVAGCAGGLPRVVNLWITHSF
jgi:hypothetical protein